MTCPRRDTLLLCLGSFAVLAVFVVLTRATGELDATLHYLNARDGALVTPWKLLTVWARPLFKALVVGPSLVGLTPARLVVAAVAAVAVGQTIALARDLDLPRPLLAGVFMLAQPYAFWMAGDVMTEIPAALAFLVATRLWMHGCRRWSCVVVSFTPLIRPEGFFLAVVWGVMVLVVAFRERQRVRTWLTCGLLLGAGMLCWCIAGLVVVRDPLIVLHTWSWPPGSYKTYGTGPLWHHFQLWPWYIGSALLPLFVVGVPFSFRKAMTLPWIVWGLVIGVHSVLYWGGWFAALGLLRILAVTSPVTAVICLIGFNKISDWLTTFRVPVMALRAMAALFIAWAGWVVLDRYHHDSQHHYHKAIWPAAEFITSHNLLRPGTTFFTSERLVLIPLQFPQGQWTWLDIGWDPARQRKLLEELPPGSVGMWDNRRALPEDLLIEDFDALGFDLLQAFDTYCDYQTPSMQYRPIRGRPDPIRFVVLRKR